MSWYSRHILPHLVERACSSHVFSHLRKEIVCQAKGRVIEIGIGTGQNFQFYDPNKVETLIGIEPDEKLIEKAQRAAKQVLFQVELVQSSLNDLYRDKHK